MRLEARTKNQTGAGELRRKSKLHIMLMLGNTNWTERPLNIMKVFFFCCWARTGARTRLLIILIILNSLFSPCCCRQGSQGLPPRFPKITDADGEPPSLGKASCCPLILKAIHNQFVHQLNVPFTSRLCDISAKNTFFLQLRLFIKQ